PHPHVIHVSPHSQLILQHPKSTLFPYTTLFRSWTKSLLPSRLGTGSPIFIGPVVSCIGCWRVERKRPPCSFMAQTFEVSSRIAWKTKYLPSGAQLPHHSLGASLHPGSTG